MSERNKQFRQNSKLFEKDIKEQIINRYVNEGFQSTLAYFDLNESVLKKFLIKNKQQIMEQQQLKFRDLNEEQKVLQFFTANQFYEAFGQWNQMQQEPQQEIEMAEAQEEQQIPLQQNMEKQIEQQQTQQAIQSQLTDQSSQKSQQELEAQKIQSEQDAIQQQKQDQNHQLYLRNIENFYNKKYSVQNPSGDIQCEILLVALEKFKKHPQNFNLDQLTNLFSQNCLYISDGPLFAQFLLIVAN